MLIQQVHTTIRKHGDVCTDQSTKMARSRTGPALTKEHQMTRWGYISGSGESLGSEGAKVTTNSNTTPQNSLSGKAGLCRAQTLGVQQ